jgi:signal transduction histidine kinase/HPt (histidine-containing phosphotransfer) domain-containing protein
MPEAIRVLLLEDDPDDARMVGLMLRRLKTGSFAVTVVARLAEALAALGGREVDVVLADLSVPDSAGLGTLNALIVAAPRLPVVVLTGNDDEALALEALKHGAQDYLVKGRGDGSELGRVIRYAIERKAAEQALTEARDKAEQAARAKSVFLAMMGHEIRTPLNGILGMTRILLETPLDKRQRTFGETVLSSGELLLGLVNDILDFARLDADGLTLQPTAFDVIGTVEEVRLVMTSRAMEKSLRLSVAIADEVERIVLGDRLRLRQILFNLVGNAIKFTDSGCVDITVETIVGNCPGQMLRFTVTDTGIGISEADRASLFTEFWQGDTTPGRRYGGAGLGLAICRRLVALMGGLIHFDSVPGQGSLFHVDLPLPVSTAPMAPAEDGRGTTDPLPLSILLVDDNQVNREVAAGLLESRGHMVISAPDGELAVELTQGHRFDAILLDMIMPGMDGLATARAIQAADDDAPAIYLLTANPEGVPEAQWREAGISGCLGKPFRVDDIARLLAGCPQRTAADTAQRIVAMDGLAEDIAALGIERMRSLTTLFHASSAADLDAAEGHAGESRFRQLAATAHKLSGAAMSLHCTALAECCRGVEDLALAGDFRAPARARDIRPLWEKSVATLAEILHGDPH